MKCLSIDFGGSSVKYGLVDDSAVILESGKLPAPTASKEQFLDTVSALYERYKDIIDGISISLPGYIDPDTGYLSGSGAYQALYGCSTAELIQEKCGKKVVVENDGKCGALAEVWQGALKDCQDGVVLIMGSAIAGGIVKNKKIHSGKGFTAGEFSFFITNPAPGCYDYRSMAMMNCCTVGITYKLCKLKNLDLAVQDFPDLLYLFDSMYAGEYPQAEGTPLKIKATGAQFIQWVEEKDPISLKIYREFINSLAQMIFNIQVLYAPEKVVIGGGLSRSDRILKDLREELAHFYEAGNIQEQLHTNIERSVYLEECNLVGAAYNYINRVSCSFGKE